jgi:ribulose-phosphate 3-epimerase
MMKESKQELFSRIKIAPSILSADFSKLGEQVQQAVDSGIEYIHVDVMDGHFFPNLTIGPLIVEHISPITNQAEVILDVHLMTENPEALIPDFAAAGANNITVHIETCPHIHRTIEQIKEFGLQAGVTLNPGTSLTSLDEILPYVDLVLIMSVNPGFGGQNYISTSTNKIRRLRDTLIRRDLAHVEIEVDGGIKPDNAVEIVKAGATVLVVGSAIFNQEASISENIQALRAAIH